MFLFLLLVLSVIVVGMVGAVLIVLGDGILSLAKLPSKKTTNKSAARKDIKKLYGKSLDYIQKHPDEDYGLML